MEPPVTAPLDEKVRELKAALARLHRTLVDGPHAGGDRALGDMCAVINTVPLLLAEREEREGQRRRFAVWITQAGDHTEVCAEVSKEGECHCGFDERFAEALVVLDEGREG